MTANSSSPVISRDAAILGRVRVRCIDPVNGGHRVRALLSATAVRADGLPDAAILCVRRWRGRLPMPGEAPQWERNLSSDLGRAIGRAVRPALEPVPSEAGAILFRDEAELLACLTMDWMAETLRAHWWWSALLNGRDPAALLSRMWLEQAAIVPAAIEVLIARGCAIPFARRLEVSVAREIARRMLAAHGITFPAPAASPAVPESVEWPIDQPAHDSISQSFHDHSSPPPIEAPWLAVVPEIHDTGLAPEAEVLIAGALLMRRAPAQARTANFERRLSQWYAQAIARQPRPVPNTPPFSRVETGRSSATQETSRPMQADPIAPHREEPAPQVARVPKPEDSLFSAAAQSIESTPTVAHPHDALAAADEMPMTTASAAVPEEPVAPLTVATMPELAEPGIVPREPSARATAPAAQDKEPVESIDSYFAGVLFLLNVALFLGYYPDFTRPADRGLDLNIWDFITLMGLEFCPAELFRRDGIWNALAGLAGRDETEAPGARFDPGEQLDQWIARTAGEIRARLKEAMNREDAVELLCRRPGRLALTPVHLDVYFLLDRHPLEIRVAGLDRDPGWIPAGGRYVHYHFD